jgi:hypothetical protein
MFASFNKTLNYLAFQSFDIEPGEGYSRNVSWPLKLISTFLLTVTRSVTLVEQELLTLTSHSFGFFSSLGYCTLPVILWFLAFGWPFDIWYKFPVKNTMHLWKKYGKKDNFYDIKIFSVAISTCIGTWHHKEIGSKSCSNLMLNISIDTNRLLVIFISCNQCLSPLKLWVFIPIMARGTQYNLPVTWGKSVDFSGYSGCLRS